MSSTQDRLDHLSMVCANPSDGLGSGVWCEAANEGLMLARSLLEQLEAAQAQLHAEQRDRNWWAANNSRERERLQEQLEATEQHRDSLDRRYAIALEDARGLKEQLEASVPRGFSITQQETIVSLKDELQDALQRRQAAEEQLEALTSALHQIVTDDDDAATRIARRALADIGPNPATVLRCGYCGSVDWTVDHYGRLTHKHACPHRADPWCQSHPEGDCDPASSPGSVFADLTRSIIGWDCPRRDCQGTPIYAEPDPAKRPT